MTTQNSINTLNDFIESMGLDKEAEANTEPGSIGGATSHPTGKEEDGTHPATEGARSSENTADIKAEVGEASVDSTPEASASDPCTAATDQMQIGMNVQATGDDPASETQRVKMDKEDPGSSHPARTDNDELDGKKYAAAELEAMSLDQLSKVAAELGDSALAHIYVQSDNAIKAAEQQNTASQAQQQSHTNESSNFNKQAYQQLAETHGWDIAGLVTGNFDKHAADAMVLETLAAITKESAEDADRVAVYLESYNQQKQAMEGEMADPAMMDPAMMDPAAGGMPGGDPAAMLAGMGGGAPGAGPEAGGGEEMQLAEILQQLGISEEELLQAIAAEEGMGAESGEMGAPMPEDNGAAPDGEGAPAEAPMEVQASENPAAVKAAAVRFLKECVARSRAKSVA